MASSTRDMNEIIVSGSLKASVKQLTCFQRARNPTDEHGFAWIQRHRSVQHKISIRQAPRTNLNRLILDGWRRHADVQLLVLHDAVLNQILDRAFVLDGSKKWFGLKCEVNQSSEQFSSKFSFNFLWLGIGPESSFSFYSSTSSEKSSENFLSCSWGRGSRWGGKTLKWKSNNSSEAKRRRKWQKQPTRTRQGKLPQVFVRRFCLCCCRLFGGKLNERKVWQDYSTLCSTFFVCFCDSVNWGSYMCTQDDLTEEARMQHENSTGVENHKVAPQTSKPRKSFSTSWNSKVARAPIKDRRDKRETCGNL